MFSKVRTSIKTKLKPEDAAPEVVEHRPGTSAKDLKAEALRQKANRNKDSQLPVVGSLDEFSKLAPSEPKATEEADDNESSAEESEEEVEGDGLWSAIMGKK